MSRGRRHLAIIDGRGLAVFQTNHHEPTAAEIAGGWMSHRERERNRDSSVDSVAATLHDVDADTRRSEEHTSELQSQSNLVCRLLLEKKNNFLTSCTFRHIK